MALLTELFPAAPLKKVLSLFPPVKFPNLDNMESYYENANYRNRSCRPCPSMMTPPTSRPRTAAFTPLQRPLIPSAAALKAFNRFNVFNVLTFQHFPASIVAAALLVLLAGCINPIGATKVSPQRAYLDLRQNALTGSHYSADAGQVLHRYGLEKPSPAIRRPRSRNSRTWRGPTTGLTSSTLCAN